MLSTKFTIPPLRSDVLSRKQLFLLLDTGLQGKLILVSAPAGYGKTTIINNWVRQNHINHTAWISLHEADNDVAKFWSYFIAALQVLWPSVGQEFLQSLQMNAAVPIENAVNILINQIASVEKMDPINLLVLDDFHLIQNDQIQNGILHFLEHMPDFLKIVITTRTDPPFPLPKMRVRRQILEIRMNELRFTISETDEFLNKIMALECSDADIQTLEQNTEGWIAGLQIAALSMKSVEKKSEFINRFNAGHKFVLDYLFDEVLTQLPLDIKEFLLQTCILPQFCAPLCDAVTGKSNSRSVLQKMEADNLFLIPLDYERLWYRYHPLFADLLIKQGISDNTVSLEAIHQKAANWHISNHHLPEAIHHAFQAGNFQQAADLIESIILDTMTKGEIGTIIQWLRTLPEEYISTRPLLCVIDANLLLLSGQVGPIEKRLQQAETGLNSLSDPVMKERLCGYCSAIRAQMLFIMNNAPQAIQYAQKAISNLSQNDHALLATMNSILGAALTHTGKFSAAIPAFEKAKAISLASGNHFNAGLASSALAQICQAQGKLHQAFQIYTSSIGQLNEHDDHQSPGLGYIYIGLADVLREWNRLDEALGYAKRGITLCKAFGQADILMTAHITLARIQYAQGKRNLAISTLHEARYIANQMSSWSIEEVDAVYMLYMVLSGNLQIVQDWIEHSNITMDGPFSFSQENKFLTLARLLQTQGKYQQAANLLDSLHNVAIEEDRVGSLVKIDVLKLKNLAAQQDEENLLEILKQLLSYAEPNQYQRIFLDEGEEIEKILYRYKTRLSVSHQTYIDRLYQFQKPYTNDDLIEPLSEREIEVLRYLVAGKSNPEIAEYLVISVNTVKTHVKSIFSKLDVHNRPQALLRAQDLNLI